MAKPAKPEPVVVEPEVLDAREETHLAKTAGGTIQEFLEGVARFFNGAAALERRAHLTLTDAKALTAPTSVDEDLAVQAVIVAAGLQKKEAEEYWSITKAANNFHKRLVAGRSRAVDVLEEASTIANGHHQRYVQLEKRRVAEEQERRRREQEEQARKDREIELQRLEDQALEAEANAPALSPREQRFLELYLQRSIDARRAAAMAGYKGIEASARLLALPKMQAAIAMAQAAELARKQAAAIKAAPVVVEHIEPVKLKIEHVAGKGDRTYWSHEMLDAEAFRDAVISGKYGIPADTLMPNPTKLNEYARSLHERLDLWPGVRHKKETKLS